MFTPGLRQAKKDVTQEVVEEAERRQGLGMVRVHVLNGSDRRRDITWVVSEIRV